MLGKPNTFMSPNRYQQYESTSALQASGNTKNAQTANEFAIKTFRETFCIFLLKSGRGKRTVWVKHTQDSQIHLLGLRIFGAHEDVWAGAAFVWKFGKVKATTSKVRRESWGRTQRLINSVNMNTYLCFEMFAEASARVGLQPSRSDDFIPILMGVLTF